MTLERQAALEGPCMRHTGPWAISPASLGVGPPTAKPLWLPQWEAALKGKPQGLLHWSSGVLFPRIPFSLVKLSWSLEVGAVPSICFSLVPSVAALVLGLHMNW